MNVWPLQVAQISSFGYSINAGLVRTPFATPHPRQTRKQKNNQRTFSVNFLLTQAELKTAKTFLQEHGFSWFEMPAISGSSSTIISTRVVRGINDSKVECIGFDTYRLSFQVEEKVTAATTLEGTSYGPVPIVEYFSQDGCANCESPCYDGVIYTEVVTGPKEVDLRRFGPGSGGHMWGAWGVDIVDTSTNEEYHRAGEVNDIGFLLDFPDWMYVAGGEEYEITINGYCHEFNACQLEHSEELASYVIPWGNVWTPSLLVDSLDVTTAIYTGWRVVLRGETDQDMFWGEIDSRTGKLLEVPTEIYHGGSAGPETWAIEAVYTEFVEDAVILDTEMVAGGTIDFSDYRGGFIAYREKRPYWELTLGDGYNIVGNIDEDGDLVGLPENWRYIPAEGHYDHSTRSGIPEYLTSHRGEEFPIKLLFRCRSINSCATPVFVTIASRELNYGETWNITPYLTYASDCRETFWRLAVRTEYWHNFDTMTPYVAEEGTVSLATGRLEGLSSSFTNTVWMSNEDPDTYEPIDPPVGVTVTVQLQLIHYNGADGCAEE